MEVYYNTVKSRARTHALGTSERVAMVELNPQGVASAEGVAS